jgi:acetyl-CoA carboxylase alpha subunit
MAESGEKLAIERVRIARHQLRPYSMDLFSSIFDDFVEIHGDRRYADDPALVCGLARLNGATQNNGNGGILGCRNRKATAKPCGR